jgi:hypothetical protein
MACFFEGSKRSSPKISKDGMLAITKDLIKTRGPFLLQWVICMPQQFGKKTGGSLWYAWYPCILVSIGMSATTPFTVLMCFNKNVQKLRPWSQGTQVDLDPSVALSASPIGMAIRSMIKDDGKGTKYGLLNIVVYIYILTDLYDIDRQCIYNLIWPILTVNDWRLQLWLQA